ncbi:G-type lectin S-receptor-like serine/threonine-protein kinase CES101 [Linum perenne]
MSITKEGGDSIILFVRLLFFFSFLGLYLCPLFSNCERDTLLQGQELKDGYHLDSAFGVFVLGFFTPPHTYHRYLGIWYKTPADNRADYQLRSYSNAHKIRPVWVGNKNPLHDKTGSLVIGSDGNLRLVNGRGDRITNVSSAVVSGPTSAILMDTGNLVLRELNPNGTVKREVWQSFDYPTDTLLPGMKLGANLRSGHVWSLKPWLEELTSDFSLGLDHNRTSSELVILWQGRVYWRSGKWVDQILGLDFSYVSGDNGEERYLIYSVKDGVDYPTSPMITITSYGTLIGGQNDKSYVDCSASDVVGCFDDDDTPICVGLNDDDFHLETINKLVFEEMAKERMRKSCRSSGTNCSKNCSCINYGRQNSDGSGCQIGMKMGYFSGVTVERTERNGMQPLLIIIGVVVPSTVLVFLFYLGWRRRNHIVTTINGLVSTTASQLWKSCGSLLVMCKKYVMLRLQMTIADAEQQILLHELGMVTGQQNGSNNDFQFFSFEHIASATSNFHPSNKLGQGGFGPVYKGKLVGGLEVAIKRLAASSKQGVVEFKNEVSLIAKLQHDNLVKLVGCCIDKGEKILVYEYLPNKSLDFSLFASTNQNTRLDWKKRFDIIQGIAQGMLYLHKYSRLKIVHRDLKASNILLDSEMKAKISDFGLAKIFHANESRAITARVAGTFGYMPPEYAMEGVFSTRSDVFSFGVLLLEIVSGKRNNHFRHDEGPSSLIAWAWELWKQGKGEEVVDSGMDRSSNVCENEALKCIHIGLLCVQENPRDRPSMLEITSMIYNQSAQLPCPNQPAFYYKVNLHEAQIIEDPAAEENQTLNEVTITKMDGR